MTGAIGGGCTGVVVGRTVWLTGKPDAEERERLEDGRCHLLIAYLKC